jgi:RsiW-degrading membrane proteinase PrsW (M82 family)
MSTLLTSLSAIFAVVPLVAFIGVMWWLDRYDREPLWLVGATFLWGAIGGTAMALVGSTYAIDFLRATVAEDQMALVTTVVVAPLIEEPTKALVLFAVALSRHFDNTTDGFLYGAATGLGFGMTENLLYFLKVAAEGDLQAWAATVAVRTLYSALMHASASSVVGAAIGWARFRGPRAMMKTVPLGLLGAIAIHGLWNGLLALSTTTGGGSVIAAANLVLFPLEFLVLFGVFQLCLLEERRMLRRELSEEVANGVLPAVHLPHLCSYLGRIGHGWLPKSVDHDAYVVAATRLAFRKHQTRLQGDDQAAKELQGYRNEIRRLLLSAGYNESNDA